MAAVESSAASSTAASPAPVRVLRVGAEPHGVCPLGSPLRLQVAFATSRDLHDVAWHAHFVADVVSAKTEVALGSSAVASYSTGGHHVAEVCVPGGIPTDGLPRNTLENICMLEVYLMDADKSELVRVRLVTDVRCCDGQSSFSRAVLDAFA
eukprot:gnl/TRDRNA2_/TRDRNA2_200119_c0_seq1.p1 gnl/TRDRNA2_/TRDRNA2_200119_c0~~gnl/TRDRNA2_/TRDRNA2_200119_c0_seq1.p1  ORF type:complete len:152 (+),score=24.01 gnl/TRDRNA2_/TRDRNA2_200119_c0_seq1:34-489(+)